MPFTISPGTPEEVAFRLLEVIALKEGKNLGTPPNDVGDAPDRDWVLQTYRECLYVVRNPQQEPSPLRRQVPRYGRR